MPPRNSGLRKPAEEKALLAEFSKMFHVAKANHKEHHNGKQSPPAPNTATAEAPKKSSGKRKAAKDSRPGSKRRSQHGGSVWMVLKGGFGSGVVPLASNAAAVERQAIQRALLSEKSRRAALEEAEAYVQSAWQQARESELVNSDNVPTEEGDAYLAEQYAVASRMLQRAPAGHVMHQLTLSCGGASDADCAEGLAKKPAFAASREEWEDLCTREAAILFRYRTSATPAVGSAEEYFKQQQHAREQSFHFATAEAVTNSGADVAPTKCIVRVRDSQRNKFTSVLTSAKAVNYFKSNIGQVLRKELAGSKLPRGGAEDGDGAPSAGAAKAHHHHNNNNSGSPNAASSGKKKRKR